MQVDIIGKPENCNGKCGGLKKKWHDWASTTGNFGGIIRKDNAVIKHNHKGAFIVLPKSYDEYFKNILTPKDRNMVRKANKNGYFGAVMEDYNSHLEDFYLINTSKNARQGRPMTSSYIEYPTTITIYKEHCSCHRIKYYGVYKDGKVYAYAWIDFLNELVIIDRILGHAAHLKYGIMNELISFIVKDSIENSTFAKYVNYLTFNSGLDGLWHFKKSVGFREYDFEFKNNYIA